MTVLDLQVAHVCPSGSGRMHATAVLNSASQAGAVGCEVAAEVGVGANVSPGVATGVDVGPAVGARVGDCVGGDIGLRVGAAVVNTASQSKAGHV